MRNKLTLILLLVPLVCRSQLLTNIVSGQRISPGTNISNVIGGTFSDGVWTFIGHTTTNGNASVTSVALNSTGCNLVAVKVTSFTGVGVTVTDNQANTYTGLTAWGSSTYITQWYYCINPTTNSSHTITVTATAAYIEMDVQMFNCAGTPTFEFENGGDITSDTTTVATPAITVGDDHRLFLAGFSCNDKGAGSPLPATIDQSFVPTDQAQIPTTSIYGGSAYRIVASSGGSFTANPTWTLSTTVNIASMGAADFYSTSGGGTSATDNFTRANSDPISNPMSDGVSTWTTMSARWDTVQVFGNVATKTVGGLSTGAAKVSSPSFSPDQTATITLGANMGHIVGVRAQSGSGSGYKLTTFSSTRLALYRDDDNGTSISDNLLTFADPGSTFTTGDTITLSISGTTLTVKYNGTVVSGMTTSDSTYSTGQPWIGEQTSSTMTLFTASNP